MIELRTGTRIWIAAGVTDMRRGFDGLSAKVQTVLNSNRSRATSSFSEDAVGIVFHDASSFRSQVA